MFSDNSFIQENILFAESPLASSHIALPQINSEGNERLNENQNSGYVMQPIAFASPSDAYGYVTCPIVGHLTDVMVQTIQYHCSIQYHFSNGVDGKSSNSVNGGSGDYGGKHVPQDMCAEETEEISNATNLFHIPVIPICMQTLSVIILYMGCSRTTTTTTNVSGGEKVSPDRFGSRYRESLAIDTNIVDICLRLLYDYNQDKTTSSHREGKGHSQRSDDIPKHVHSPHVASVGRSDDETEENTKRELGRQKDHLEGGEVGGGHDYRLYCRGEVVRGCLGVLGHLMFANGKIQVSVESVV